MRDLVAILLVFFAIGGALFMMMLSAREAEKVRAKAQALIGNPIRLALGEERVFRKPRSSGYLLIVFFFGVLGLVAYGLIHSSGLRIAGAGIAVLFASLGALVMGIRSLKYAVRVSSDRLTISDLTTKSIPLRDIGEVTIGVSKASSFCQIRLNTGEEDVSVPSDLEHFPEFVSLLAESVEAAKAGSG